MIKPGQVMIEESQRRIGQFYNKKYSLGITKYEQSRKNKAQRERQQKINEFGKTVDFDNEELEPDFVYEKKALKIKSKASSNLPSSRSKTTQKYKNTNYNYPVKMLSDRSEKQRFKVQDKTQNKIQTTLNEDTNVPFYKTLETNNSNNDIIFNPQNMSNGRSQDHKAVIR